MAVHRVVETFHSKPHITLMVALEEKSEGYSVISVHHQGSMNMCTTLKSIYAMFRYTTGFRNLDLVVLNKKSGESPKSIRFILWVPWMSGPCWMRHVGRFCTEWLTDQAVRSMLLAWPKMLPFTLSQILQNRLVLTVPQLYLTYIDF